MNIASMVAVLRDEQRRIDRAIQALEGLTPNNKVGNPQTVRTGKRKAKKAGHEWTPKQRRAQAKRMKDRWKNGELNKKKPHLVKKTAA